MCARLECLKLILGRLWDSWASWVLEKALALWGGPPGFSQKVPTH